MQQPDKIQTFLWRRAHDGTINSHCEPGLIESCPAGGLFVELFVWSAVYPLVTFPRTHTRCLAEWSLDTTHYLPAPSLHQFSSFLFLLTRTPFCLYIINIPGKGPPKPPIQNAPRHSIPQRKHAGRDRYMGDSGGEHLRMYPGCLLIR